MKTYVDYLLEEVFDGMSDWYAVVDELDSPQEAEEAMQGHDAVAWFDNDVRDTIFGVDRYDNIVRIYVLQSDDVESALYDLEHCILDELHKIWNNGIWVDISLRRRRNNIVELIEN